MPAARIFRFARTSRCAIVASGTRNARAISSVVSPPSVRSVSATCASSASAGWQHVNIRLEPLVGERVVVHLVLLCRRGSASSSRRRLRAQASRSRRIRSIARLRAVVDEPGAGVAPGRRRAASARRRSRTPPARRPRRGRSRRGRRPGSRATRPHSSRKTCSSGSARSALHERAHLDRAVRAPPGSARRPRSRRRGSSASNEVVAAERLLRLGERPVGRQRLAVADADGRRGVAPAAARRRRGCPASPRLPRTRRRSPAAPPRCALPSSVVAVDQQCVLHRLPPSVVCRLYDERAAPKSTSRAARNVSAPSLSSMSFRLPHFGLWTHDGQPLEHGQPREQLRGVRAPSPRTPRSRAR